MAHVIIMTDDEQKERLWRALLATEHSVLTADISVPDSARCVAAADAVVVVDTEIIAADFGNIAGLIRQGLKLLVVGADWQQDRQINALVAGCYGYCEAGAASELLSKAVACILKGDIWIPRHLAPRIIGLLAKLAPAAGEPETARVDRGKTIEVLTQRERDVAKMLGEGLSNKLIASLLNISERTVKAHLTSIFQKLEVRDRLQLALLIRDYI